MEDYNITVTIKSTEEEAKTVGKLLKHCAKTIPVKDMIKLLSAAAKSPNMVKMATKFV